MIEEELSKSVNSLFDNLLLDDSTFENEISTTPNDDQVRLLSVEDALTHIDQFVTENEGASAMCEKQTSEQTSTHSDFFFAGTSYDTLTSTSNEQLYPQNNHFGLPGLWEKQHTSSSNESENRLYAPVSVQKPQLRHTRKSSDRLEKACPSRATRSGQDPTSRRRQ